jgi:hypothetical protein
MPANAEHGRDVVLGLVCESLTVRVARIVGDRIEDGVGSGEAIVSDLPAGGLEGVRAAERQGVSLDLREGGGIEVGDVSSSSCKCGGMPGSSRQSPQSMLLSAGGDLASGELRLNVLGLRPGALGLEEKGGQVSRTAIQPPFRCYPSPRAPRVDVFRCGDALLVEALAALLNQVELLSATGDLASAELAAGV